MPNRSGAVATNGQARRDWAQRACSFDLAAPPVPNLPPSRTSASSAQFQELVNQSRRGNAQFFLSVALKSQQRALTRSMLHRSDWGTNERRQRFQLRLKMRMDDAFCARLRKAIAAGLESAPIGVITTPGKPKIPRFAHPFSFGEQGSERSSGLFEAMRFCGEQFASKSRARTATVSSHTAPRRFPPPWSVEELDACFVVIDSAGQKLAYIYFEEEARAEISGQAAHER
jgi:hypothetical protein